MYVLHVKPGCEETACQELSKKGIKAIAPTRILIIRRGGKWHQYESLIFTSYIFVEFDYSDKAYYDIKSCTGVIRLLGAEHKPEPMAEYEQMYIRWLWNNGRPIQPLNAYVTLDKKVIPTQGNSLKLHEHVVEYKIRQQRAVLKINILNKDYKFSLACNFIH